MTNRPVIVWLRRDLRLADHPALSAASALGPVIPLFIHDETVEAMGAAPKWRLAEGLCAYSAALKDAGSRLILRRGNALDVLKDVIRETGATAIYWQRVYDRDGIARDRKVKTILKDSGLDVQSFPGAVLFEPWDIATATGGPYKVFTPFWRALRGREVAPPLPSPVQLIAPAEWPRSERLEDWAMGEAMNRGAAIVAPYAVVGEVAARTRLDRFIAERLRRYADERDYPAVDATSGLSENLAWGEISARSVWQAGFAAHQDGMPGAEKFLSELAWRDFAWHLMYHFPDMDRANWRSDWDGFPWRDDNADAERWRRGLTGEPFVDAALREMFVTGRMHNRARMIAASYLTKHLLTDWRVGLKWFANCLTDWDPASNAMGWQWVAGSGPDAAPFFRIFNPETQASKFDSDGAYRAAYIAEGQANPPATAQAYFDAVPRSWHMSPDAPYPSPIVDLKTGRERALAAYRG